MNQPRRVKTYWGFLLNRSGDEWEGSRGLRGKGLKRGEGRVWANLETQKAEIVLFFSESPE